MFYVGCQKKEIFHNTDYENCVNFIKEKITENKAKNINLMYFICNENNELLYRQNNTRLGKLDSINGKPIFVEISKQ